MSYRTKDNPSVLVGQPLELIDANGNRTVRSINGGAFSEEVMFAHGYYQDVEPEFDPAMHKLGDVPVWDEEAGTVTMAVVAKTAEELAAELQAWREIAEVTMRQARLILSRNNLLLSVQGIISQLGGEAAIEWEFAGTVKRTHPLVVAVAQQAGMTDTQIDQMFRDAGTL